MENFEARRIQVINLHIKGKRQCEIVKLLKLQNVTQSFVSKTIKRYIQTGSTENKLKSGRPRSKRTAKMINALKARIRRNPCRSQKKLALQMGVSKTTIRRALKLDLGLKPLKKTTCHMMTMKQKKNRIILCKALLKRYAPEQVKSILFTDEKIFTVEGHFNKQNDRVYAKSVKLIPKKHRYVKRSHHPGYLMVWVGISWSGNTQLHFVEKGVKVSAKNYMDNVLNPIIKPLNTSLFKNGSWTLQQDSAPAHKAKMVQKWLKDQIPDFISHTEWPSASPDLNPLDYCIWSKLEEMVCSKPHTSVEALKKSLIRVWAKFPQKIVRTAIEDWRCRLKACIAAKGENFEN